MTEFKDGADRYQAIVDHECTNDSDCPMGEAFYIIGFRDNHTNELTVYAGGHQASPSTIAQGSVETIDAIIIASRPEGVPSPIAFARARQLVHDAADQVDPPADVSADLSSALFDMVERHNEENNDGL